MAVFTNLSPEHLERHGGFENYRKAKGKLFQKLSGQSIIIANNDDKHVNYFLSFPAYQHITYAINNQADIKAEGTLSNGKGSFFLVKGQAFQLPLLGDFNIYNALAAVAVGRSQNIEYDIIKKALAGFKVMPGRMEQIRSSKGFSVFIDYAHTVDSLEKVYKNLKPLSKRLIAVLGAAGGGRDKTKRPKLGKLASQYADIAIVTNEDPYDEDPEKIINEVWQGLPDAGIEKYRIMDRGEAIKKALNLAQKGDIVVITGKGSEQCIVTRKGKLKWDDRDIVKQNMTYVREG